MGKGMVAMRWTTVMFAFVFGAGVWPAAPAVAEGPAAAQQLASAGSVRADFDHDGAGDLAVGVPAEDAGTVVDAGAVNVLYGGGGGLSGAGSQLFTQVGNLPEPSDRFGFALAAADFNHDGFADLAVGAPFEDAGPLVDVGAVSVLYGSAGGLTRTGGQLFTQVGSPLERSDRFGFALAAGDFNRDGFADLATGAPFEDAGPVDDAGAVSVLYGSAGGLTRTGGQLFTQVGAAFPEDGPAVGDQFGAALATGDLNGDGFADLAAGAPGETLEVFRHGEFLDWIPGVGAVSGLYGSAGGLTSAGGWLIMGGDQAKEAFGSTLAAGDFNRDDFAALAIGIPNRAGGWSIAEAGAVAVRYSSAVGFASGQDFTQVGSAPEAGDHFGGALAAGDFNRDGFADLATGAPFEDVSRIVDAGAVSVQYGSAVGLTINGGQIFTQIGSAAEAGDHFGGELAAGDFNRDGFADLATGAPAEDVFSVVNAGAVSVQYGGLSRTGPQIFTQNSPGVTSAAERGDLFGGALAAG
jgi:hypothetical protein